MVGRGFFQKVFIKSIAYPCDARNQFRQRCRCFVGACNSTAYARCHQDGACKNCCCFERIFFEFVCSVIDSVFKNIKQRLTHDESAESALLIDVVWVPFAEEIIRAKVCGVGMIIATNIHGKFIEVVEIEIRLGK